MPTTINHSDCSMTPMFKKLHALPDEILLLIANEVACHDIKPWRRVCKRFSRIGGFGRLVVSPYKSGLDGLAHLSSSHLRWYVTEIDWHFEVFTPESSIPSPQSSDWEFQEAFAIFQKAICVQERFTQEMQRTAVLANILGCFENLHSLSLTHVDTHTLWDYTGGNHDPTSSLDAEKHSIGHQVFEALVAALSCCQGKIQKLVLGKGWQLRGQGFASIIQGLSSESSRYDNPFGHVRDLELALPSDMKGSNQLNFPGVFALIQSMTELENFTLLFDGFIARDSIPEKLLASTHIPKLEKLHVDAAKFRHHTELLEFLSRHASTLRFLTLHSIVLEDGSWENLLVGLRSKLFLDSFDIFNNQIETDGVLGPLQGDMFYIAAVAFVLSKSERNPFEVFRAPGQLLLRIASAVST
ncbi:hypothetical protein JX265_014076 [Neoarthrinium moseri]|uniref:F-box domain-containing protein n=1 Tax=Neoarthrinium moseri TaxID=1658444 RepID=A0A9Q0AFD7_9PEZI|nr:hypothetical protein JX265_014076 [Neoarthrinium moseri]